MKKDLINNLLLFIIAIVITLIIIFLQPFIVYALDDFEIIKINEESYKVFKYGFPLKIIDANELVLEELNISKYNNHINTFLNSLIILIIIILLLIFIRKIINIMFLKKY